MKKLMKPLLSLLLVLSLCGGFALVSFAEQEEEPLLRIAMFSDLHVEFGLQDLKKPIRPSTEKAVQYLLDDLTDGDGVDVFLVGGDMTGPRGNWDQATITKTKNSIHETLSSATVDGKVFYVMGNHDPEPTHDVGENKTSDYSGDYLSLMEESFGDPVSILWSSDINSGLSPYDEPLCYRYTVKGIEFIGLNTPYVEKSCSGLYPDQTEWLEEELATIGKDKTVFIVCHYPLTSLRTLLNKNTYATENQCKKDLERLFKEYTNVVYCFGHTHSGDSRWAKSRTSDLVKPDGMSLAGQGIYKNRGYIDAHMGSMGYYDNVYQPGGLTADDPMIVQFVTVDLYADRMVFQAHNTGEKYATNGKKDVDPLVIARDLGPQMGISAPVTDSSTNGTDGTGSSETSVPTAPEENGGSLLPTVLLCVLGVILVAGVAVIFVLLRKKPSVTGPKDGRETD